MIHHSFSKKVVKIDKNLVKTQKIDFLPNSWLFRHNI